MTRSEWDVIGGMAVWVVIIAIIMATVIYLVSEWWYEKSAKTQVSEYLEDVRTQIEKGRITIPKEVLNKMNKAKATFLINNNPNDEVILSKLLDYPMQILVPLYEAQDHTLSKTQWFIVSDYPEKHFEFLYNSLLEDEIIIQSKRSKDGQFATVKLNPEHVSAVKLRLRTFHKAGGMQ